MQPDVAAANVVFFLNGCGWPEGHPFHQAPCVGSDPCRSCLWSCCGGGPEVPSAAEGQNQIADAAQQEQQDHAKYRALAEGFRHVDGHDYRDHNVDERNEHKDEPPCRTAYDLEHDVDVEKGDDDGPSRLASLLEDL